MSAIFEISCVALGSDAQLLGLRGTEALSQPFSYVAYLSLPIDAVPEASSVLTQTVTMVVRPDDDAADKVHGIISGLRVIDVTDDRALAAVSIEPRLANLARSRHSRVFTEQNIQAVISDVLTRSGLADGTDFEFRLSSAYPDLAHVCQYKESDLAFISRWLEREGMYYFFDHSEDVDKLVITDQAGAHPDGPSDAVRYVPLSSPTAEPTTGTFARFRSRRIARPNSVRFVDYDYMRPALEVAGEEAASDTTSANVVLHGVATDEPAEAARLAKVLAEAHAAAEQQFDAAGPVFRLHAGTCFKLSEHPRSGRNQAYLCIGTDIVAALRAASAKVRNALELQDDEVYRVRPHAIAKNTPFRSLPRTPTPRIHGVERATVDGPADGDDAQLDDEGRYRIKLAFDESELSDGAASLPVRMLEPHAGDPEGWHLPLRKGTEVMVAFVGGHPDRPVIAASVPNAETPSPVTEANNTHNILITGGENIVEIEDQDGNQWCDWRSPTKETYLHLGTPHDPTPQGSREKHTHYIVGNTQADCLFSIGANQDIRVGGQLTEKVEGDVSETYDTSQTTTIKATQTTFVENAVVEKYTGGQKTEVTGKVDEFYNAKQTTTVTGARGETYNVGHNTLVKGLVKQTYNAAQDLTVHGSSIQLYKSTLHRTTVGGETKYLFDSNVTQLFGPTKEIHCGTTWSTKNGATLNTKQLTISTGVAEEHGFFYDKAANMISKVELSVLKLGVVLLEFYGIDICIGAVRANMTGWLVEGFGLRVDLCAAFIETRGLLSRFSAFKKH